MYHIISCIGQECHLYPLFLYLSRFKGMRKSQRNCKRRVWPLISFFCGWGVKWVPGGEGRNGGGVRKDARAGKPEACWTIETVSYLSYRPLQCFLIPLT